MMNEFLNQLLQHIQEVENICMKMEDGEACMESVRNYLPSLNQMIMTVFDLQQTPEYSLEISQEFMLQVLNDLIYGIENEDYVFLLDVLRYGLLEVFYYIAAEVQSEGQDE